MNKRLLAEFNIQNIEKSNEYSDYETFQNKELLEELRQKVLNELSTISNEEKNINIIKEKCDKVISNYNLNDNERNYLYDLIQSEITSKNPLDYLIADDNITEIMVNSTNEIYVEVDGVLKKDETVSFINDEHIVRTINSLIKNTDVPIYESNPIIDTNMEDGSRITAIIPPLSKNPVVTIKKFKHNVETIEDLLGKGMLTAEMARLLSLAIEGRLNILVTGSSGSGKTSLLNIICNLIPNEERIVTIEDTFELQLKDKHAIPLETIRNNKEKEITLKDLVNTAIRLRPDRIVIGEIRGEEAFDYLESMNIGYEGTISTLHANNASDAMSRLETMSMTNSHKIPLEIIKKYITNTIDMVVHISRMKDGRRRITEIVSIEGIKNNEIELKHLFEFKELGTNDKGITEGEYIKKVGENRVLSKLLNKGLSEAKDIFKESKKEKTNKADKMSV